MLLSWPNQLILLTPLLFWLKQCRITLPIVSTGEINLLKKMTTISQKVFRLSCWDCLDNTDISKINLKQLKTGNIGHIYPQFLKLDKIVQLWQNFVSAVFILLSQKLHSKRNPIFHLICLQLRYSNFNITNWKKNNLHRTIFVNKNLKLILSNENYALTSRSNRSIQLTSLIWSAPNWSFRPYIRNEYQLWELISQNEAVLIKLSNYQSYFKS